MQLLVILGLWACGETKTDTASEPTSEPSGDTASEPSNEDTGPQIETFSISGVMNNADGQPASGAKVQVCAALCRRADVMEDGTWSLQGVEADVYIVLGFYQGDASIATTASLATVSADLDVGTMVMSPYATQEAFVSGMYDYVLDGGLVISANSDELSAGLYSIGSSASVSSVKIDPSHISGGDLDTSTAAAMWMLGEYDYHVEGGMPWRIDSDLGLEEGASVDVQYLDNEAHEWLSLGTFTVTDGVIDGGESNLPLLSSLIVIPQ